MKSQALAIALVVMCGVGTYIMFLTTLGALRATQDSYYRDYRFAEVFVTLKRAPESLRQRVQAIAEVDQVEAGAPGHAGVRRAGDGLDGVGIR